jgi:hypothetical protein
MISWHSFEKPFLNLKSRFDYPQAWSPEDSSATVIALAPEQA